MDHQSDTRTAIFGQDLNAVLRSCRRGVGRSKQFAKLGNGDA